MPKELIATGKEPGSEAPRQSYIYLPFKVFLNVPCHDAHPTELLELDLVVDHEDVSLIQDTSLVLTDWWGDVSIYNRQDHRPAHSSTWLVN